MELVHSGLLGVDLGLGDLDLVLQVVRVETGEDLSFFDRIAFLREDFGDAVAVLEGEGYFAEVDIAVDRKRPCRNFRLMMLIEGKGAGTDEHDDDSTRNDAEDAAAPDFS